MHEMSNKNLNLKSVFRVFQIATNNDTITNNLAFSDDVTFPLSECVTWQNLQI
jgi:hypothetical protein